LRGVRRRALRPRVSVRVGTSGLSLTDRTRRVGRTVAHGVVRGDPFTSPEGEKGAESIVKGADAHSADPEQVQRFRVSKFRVALVREGSIPTTWDKTVREPGDVARLMAPLLVDLDRETFWVVMLDGKNRVIGVNLVSVGSLNAALVHP